MASSWGTAWDVAWGDSWGGVVAPVVPPVKPTGSGRTIIRRKKRKPVQLVFTLAPVLIVVRTRSVAFRLSVAVMPVEAKLAVRQVGTAISVLGGDGGTERLCVEDFLEQRDAGELLELWRDGKL